MVVDGSIPGAYIAISGISSSRIRTIIRKGINLSFGCEFVRGGREGKYLLESILFVGSHETKFSSTDRFPTSLHPRLDLSD